MLFLFENQSFGGEKKGESFGRFTDMHCADVPAVVPTVGLGSLKDPLRMNVRVCVCACVCDTRGNISKGI